MKEAHRVLAPDGRLWVKCMDEIESGRQRRSEIEVYQMAMELGFVDQDKFVLPRTSAVNSARWGCQLHARCNVSYLWAFKK